MELVVGEAAQQAGLAHPRVPVRSSRNSTSYCFAMAGPERAKELLAAGSALLRLGHRGAAARPAENGAGEREQGWHRRLRR